MVLAAVAIANAFIRPVILFFAWPVNCLTFGLFGFGLNVGLFWLAAASVPGFVIQGPLNALIGFAALGIVSGLLNMFLRDKGERASRRK
jgi:putative membrane protein